MSVFHLSCPDCGAGLEPVEAWIWRCAACEHRFEVCGGFVVDAPADSPCASSPRATSPRAPATAATEPSRT